MTNRQWIIAQRPYTDRRGPASREVRLYIDRDATELLWDSERGTARVHVLTWSPTLLRWERHPDVVLVDSIVHLGPIHEAGPMALYDRFRLPWPKADAQFLETLRYSDDVNVHEAVTYWQRRADAGSAYDYGQRYADLAREELRRRGQRQSTGQ